MLPALIGISGHEVGAEEEAAIRRLQPAGFILFTPIPWIIYIISIFAQ